MNRQQRRAAQRAGPDHLNGERRAEAAKDPMLAMAEACRATFGDVEAERLLALSLERIPPEGARVGRYAQALRETLREEKPEWSSRNLKPEEWYADEED